MSNIKAIWRSQPTQDGDGVSIERQALFQQPLADPFLMLDELKSKNPKDYIGGFPPHPHKGMETLTLMKSGEMSHRDHMGNEGHICPGGAQWMSAGRGVIHSEMPAQSPEGLHGFQLWINLPANDKLKEPDYQDAPASQIPALDIQDGVARVVAGQWSDNSSGQVVVGPLSRIAGQAGVLDIEANPEASMSIPIPKQHQVLVYVYSGGISVEGEASIGPGHMLAMGQIKQLEFIANNEGAGLLVLAGRPIQEPVVHYGPFVMNTRQEIEEALNDYRDGNFVSA